MSCSRVFWKSIAIFNQVSSLLLSFSWKRQRLWQCGWNLHVQENNFFLIYYKTKNVEGLFPHSGGKIVVASLKKTASLD